MPDSAPSPMSVRFRGVRGSTPSPGPGTIRYGGNTSCLEVRADDQILILDAGTGIRVLGDDLMTEFGTKPIVATLLISHTHWDHIQGLPFFAPAYLPENRISLIGAKGWGPTLKRAMQNQMEPITFPVPLTKMYGLLPIEELSSDQVDLGRFVLKVIALNHPGGCAGFRIEAGGASFAYLPDHEPWVIGDSLGSDARTAGLIDFVRGVELLVLDTQYTRAEYDEHRGWGHGCLPDSIALAVKAGVSELAFFHHDPLHDDARLDEMISQGQELARSTELIVTAATEGKTINLDKLAGIQNARSGIHRSESTIPIRP